MAFQYRARSAELWDKYANQTSSDFEGIIRGSYASRTFKPKKGDNTIRILPPTWEDADHYGITVYVHYGVGPNNAQVLCLSKTQNKRCPICEACAQARNRGDDELARALNPAKKTVAWVLNREDEDKGPLVWAMPAVKADAEISKISRNRKTGKLYHIDHPETGNDVYFTLTGEKMNVQYGGWQIEPETSPVKDKWLDFIEAHPIQDVLLWRSYDEIMTLYRGGEDEDDEAPARRSASQEEDETPVSRRRMAPAEEMPEPITRRRPSPARQAPQADAELDDDIPFDDAASDEAASNITSTVANLRARLNKPHG